MNDTNQIAFEFHELMDDPIETFYINQDFPQHASEFKVDSSEVQYVKQDDSEEFDFRVGSYSTYNKFRNLLSLAIHGIKVESLWDNEHKYAGTALWDLLNFSDCEGVIDSIVSTKILKDLEDNRDKFIEYLKKDTDIGEMDTEHYAETYNNFINAFKLGANLGIVIFC